MKYVFWAFILTLIVVQTIAYILWRIAFRSPNKTQNDDHSIGNSDQILPIADKINQAIDELNAIPYELVETVSLDELKLHARLYLLNPGAPFVICCHGYRGTPSRDFAVGSKIMINKGLNLLLIEQRSHKSSEGNSITMGVKERKDCLGWIRYIVERFGTDTKIVLCGVSMGAATVLLASGMNIPDNVKGVIADSPYSSPKAITTDILKKMKLPPRLCYLFLTIGSWLFGKFNLNDKEADVVESAKRIKIPVLLIHGGDDRFVPYGMSVLISNANPEMIEFHSFESAGHGLSCLVEPERYHAIMENHLNKVLN